MSGFVPGRAHYANIDGHHAVDFGDASLVLFAEWRARRGTWRFRVFDTRFPRLRTSSWVTLSQPSDLNTNKGAVVQRPIRDEYGRNDGNARLDEAVLYMQENADLFVVEEEPDARTEQLPEGIQQFSEGGTIITLLSADGVRLSASNLFFTEGGNTLVGELTYSHALIHRAGLDGSSEEIETIVPVLVWAVHENGVVVGRHIRPLEMTPMLTLSNRDILIELKTRSASTLGTLIDLGTANEFVNSRDCISWTDAYTRIKEEVRRYVGFGWDQRIYDVVSCWALGTYFIELFAAYPFLYPYGSQGSGKTRLLYVITLLSRHGFIATDPSDAALYRTADAFRPTMGIDESILGEEAWTLIRTAFKKGSRVPRIEKTAKDEFLLNLFETYMPLCFASTKLPSQLGGGEADEARAIFVFMQQERDPIGRDPEPVDFQDLRNELYLVRLLRVGDVLQALRREETTIRGFRGHEREVWLPLFTIASIVGTEVYENVCKYAEEANAQKRFTSYEEEKSVIGGICLLFNELVAQTLDGKKVVEFSPTILVPYIRQFHINQGEHDEDSFRKFWTARRIGRLLSRMSIIRRRLSSGRFYKVSKKDLETLMQRYDYDNSVISAISVISDVISEEVGGKENDNKTPEISPKNASLDVSNIVTTPPTPSQNNYTNCTNYTNDTKPVVCYHCRIDITDLPKFPATVDGVPVQICEGCHASETSNPLTEPSQEPGRVLLSERLRALREVWSEIEQALGDDVTPEGVLDYLGEHRPDERWTCSLLEQIIEIAKLDGWLYQPRPGIYKMAGDGGV